MKQYPHVLALLFDQPWAITPRALESMIARVEQSEGVDLEALASKLGRPLENTGGRVEMRDRTAVIDVGGPIFRYANLFTMLSHATSVESLARNLQAAQENPAVDDILLRIDSPGGQVNGIADFADMVHSSKKPVTAFVDGLGASAAYWIASAAGKVYGSLDSFSGSIGVVATLTDRKAAQERQGVKTYSIVSSQSPRKNLDPATEEGHAAILEMVDSLGALFVESVARYRGVTAEKVMGDFGQGGVKPARLALASGMIDGIQTEEGLLAGLKSNPMVAGFAAKESTMPAEATTAATPATTAATPPSEPAVTAEERVASERNRIQTILSLPEATGRERLASVLAFDPTMDPERARAILAATDKGAAASLASRMAQVPNPTVGVGADAPVDNTAAAEAARILAFIPPHQRVKTA
jgi:ClpP class serine protease